VILGIPPGLRVVVVEAMYLLARVFAPPSAEPSPTAEAPQAAND